MDRVTETTKDCFDAIIQLRQSEAAAVPPPEVLHHRLRATVDEMLRRAAVLGYSHGDAQDMAYAMVALMDEVVLGKPDHYRQFWMSNLLQLHYFSENVAGDGFYAKLDAIRKDTHRAEVLQVYSLCMMFGFQGRYRIRGGELEWMTLIDSVQKELERARPLDFDALSPHGERPPEPLTAKRGRASLLALSFSAVALALLVYGGLYLSLDSYTRNLVSEIRLHVAKTARSAQ